MRGNSALGCREVERNLGLNLSGRSRSTQRGCWSCSREPAASWFTALAGVKGSIEWVMKKGTHTQREREREREEGAWRTKKKRKKFKKLPAFGVPFRGWLTTTGWLSQRRRESNFFSCRQQLQQRVQAKLQRSLPPSLSLLHSLFLSLFFSLSLSLSLSPPPSSFCPPSSTGCSLVRVISLSTQPAGAGVRSRRRRVPGPVRAAPLANGSRAFW